MSRTTNLSSRPRIRTAALTVLGVLAAAATLVSPAIGSADEQAADGMQTNVYYTQLDLATEQGTRALYRRLEKAAEEVCPASTSLLPRADDERMECQRQAIARAIGQIGSSRLAAIDAQVLARRG